MFTYWVKREELLYCVATSEIKIKRKIYTPKFLSVHNYVSVLLFVAIEFIHSIILIPKEH